MYLFIYLPCCPYHASKAKKSTPAILNNLQAQRWTCTRGDQNVEGVTGKVKPLPRTKSAISMHNDDLNNFVLFVVSQDISKTRL